MKTIETPQPLFPHWMRGFLLLAMAYNVAWGAFIFWYPGTFYQWVTTLDTDAPSIIIWQGRFAALMGFAYLFGALYPRKFWYLILVGAATKIVGGIWFYINILDSQPEKSGLFHLIMNDGVWVPVLLFIGFKAYSIRNEEI
jgi:hypothetical protein